MPDLHARHQSICARRFEDGDLEAEGDAWVSEEACKNPGRLSEGLDASEDVGGVRRRRDRLQHRSQKSHVRLGLSVGPGGDELGGRVGTPPAAIADQAFFLLGVDLEALGAQRRRVLMFANPDLQRQLIRLPVKVQAPGVVGVIVPVDVHLAAAVGNRQPVVRGGVRQLLLPETEHVEESPVPCARAAPISLSDSFGWTIPTASGGCLW
jgi:hypothetical protein